jgi:L-lactate dehydrogenase complex protein LldG
VAVLELFETRAAAVSAEVRRVPSPSAAVHAVLEVLAEERVGDEPGARAVWCEGSLLRGQVDHGALARRFPGLSFEVTRERAAASRVGVSEFDWALAATGTLAQDATDPRLRLVSTLPETHVALVRTAAVLPDLECLLARLDPRRVRWLACVTGPSRTADIERVLTIGVHGPRRLVILAVDAPPEPACPRT